MTASTVTNTASGTGNTAITIGEIGSIGGSLHIGNCYTWFDSQYFEPNLDEFSSEEWVEPVAADSWVEELAEHHLLILGGELDDLTACAQHLAYRLRARLAGMGSRLLVRQRSGGTEPQRIESALRGDDPVVLLLIDATPSSIGGFQSIGELRRNLRSAQAFAIVTTRCGREEWEAPEGSFEGRFWRTLHWRHYYGLPLLIEFLRNQLAKGGLAAKDGLFLETSSGDILAPGLSFESIVERLQSPSRLKDFASWILSAPTVPSRDQLVERLSMLEGNKSAVENWYRQFNSRDQLLVLGLTLFDGLSDDLVFMGLELLVESTWRAADPFLVQFDYQDLKRFSTYFQRTETAGGFGRIDCISSKHRAQILDLAWRFQRRRLLSCLPVLTRLIRASAQGALHSTIATDSETAANPAVLVTATQRFAGSLDEVRFSKREVLELHSALVGSLSLISRLSFEVVEPYFLDLAADANESVRQLVARALSSWWATGHREHLLRLLRTWWEAAVDYEREDPRLDRLGKSSREPRSAVRAVIALIVGYAARFERPNQLSPELYDLLAVLLEDRDPAVRQALRSTVTLVAAWHLRQVEPLIRTKALGRGDLLQAIAEGAAEACSMRPDEAFGILDHWRMAAKAERWKLLIPRELLLAAVALSHGFIQCDETRAALTPEAVGGRLRSMLTEEVHPYVRQCAFFAVEIQVVRNLSLLSLILKELLSAVTVDDRPAAVEIFVRTYLHQRLRLVGGDDRVEIGEFSFAIWSDGTRPLTEIEATLYSWMVDSSSPATQQLAVDVFEALAETAVERVERGRGVARPSEPVSSADSGPVLPGQPPEPTYSLSWLGRVAARLATPNKPGVRRTLEPLLAELIRVQNRATGLRTTFTSKVLRPLVVEKPAQRGQALIGRWSLVPNESTRAISRNLRRALIFYRWRWFLVGVALMALLWVGIGSVTLYRTLTSTLTENRQGEDPAGPKSQEIKP